MELLSVSEYAKRHGISRQAVYKKIERGQLTVVKKELPHCNIVRLIYDEDPNRKTGQKLDGIAVDKVDNQVDKVDRQVDMVDKEVSPQAACCDEKSRLRTGSKQGDREVYKVDSEVDSKVDSKVVSEVDTDDYQLTLFSFDAPPGAEPDIKQRPSNSARHDAAANRSAQLEAAIAARDERIKRLEADAAARDERIMRLEAALQDKDTRIGELTSKLTELSDRIITLSEQAMTLTNQAQQLQLAEKIPKRSFFKRLFSGRDESPV